MVSLYLSITNHTQTVSKHLLKMSEKNKMTKKEIEEATKIIADFNTMLSDKLGKSDIKLLEIRSLKSGIELSKATLQNLKNDFKRNIFYVLLGGLIGIISSLLLSKYQATSEERIIELSKLLTEKNEQQSDFQKRLNDMNTELLLLKTELDSLKSFNKN